MNKPFKFREPLGQYVQYHSPPHNHSDQHHTVDDRFGVAGHGILRCFSQKEDTRRSVMPKLPRWRRRTTRSKVKIPRYIRVPRSAVSSKGTSGVNALFLSISISQSTLCTTPLRCRLSLPGSGPSVKISI